MWSRPLVGTSLIQVVQCHPRCHLRNSAGDELAVALITGNGAACRISSRFLSKNQTVFGRVQEQLGDLNAVCKRTTGGIRVVKAFVREPAESRYTRLNEDLVNMQTISAIRNTFPLIFC